MPNAKLEIYYADGLPVSDKDILAEAGRIAASKRKSKGGGQPSTLTTADRKRMNKMKTSGHSCQFIATTFGVSQRTIRRHWNNDNGNG